jgi:uncharacterized coiled-coil protein SlyX
MKVNVNDLHNPLGMAIINSLADTDRMSILCDPACSDVDLDVIVNGQHIDIESLVGNMQFIGEKYKKYAPKLPSMEDVANANIHSRYCVLSIDTIERMKMEKQECDAKIEMLEAKLAESDIIIRNLTDLHIQHVTGDAVARRVSEYEKTIAEQKDKIDALNKMIADRDRVIDRVDELTNLCVTDKNNISVRFDNDNRTVSSVTYNGMLISKHYWKSCGIDCSAIPNDKFIGIVFNLYNSLVEEFGKDNTDQYIKCLNSIGSLSKSCRNIHKYRREKEVFLLVKAGGKSTK